MWGLGVLGGDGAKGGCGGSGLFWAGPYPFPSVPSPHLPA
jgi:hypothetical protein